MLPNEIKSLNEILIREEQIAMLNEHFYEVKNRVDKWTDGWIKSCFIYSLEPFKNYQDLLVAVHA